MAPHVSLAALQDLPEVGAGDDLAALIVTAAERGSVPITDHTTIVVAQKVVSKAEGRFVRLSAVSPSARAQALAEATGKDPRVVELILGESEAVLRAVPGVLIVRHRLGHVMANAGIDRSNVPCTGAEETVLLLPLDPDRSAHALRDAIAARCSARPGVLISDSFGRPWRNGVVNVALGAAGIPSVVDRRGETDRMGRRLEVTQIAFADAICAAAGLVMGEGGGGHARGRGRGPRRPLPRCATARLRHAHPVARGGSLPVSAIGQSHVVAQSGGLAGAKLAHRLLQALPAGIPRVFLNTGNDLNPLGLRTPPDIDTARHTLANLQAGWRRRGQNLDLARALSNPKGGRKS